MYGQFTPEEYPGVKHVPCTPANKNGPVITHRAVTRIPATRPVIQRLDGILAAESNAQLLKRLNCQTTGRQVVSALVGIRSRHR